MEQFAHLPLNQQKGLKRLMSLVGPEGVVHLASRRQNMTLPSGCKSNLNNFLKWRLPPRCTQFSIRFSEMKLRGGRNAPSKKPADTHKKVGP
jgi:hypothetical protein